MLNQIETLSQVSQSLSANGTQSVSRLSAMQSNDQIQNLSQAFSTAQTNEPSFENFLNSQINNVATVVGKGEATASDTLQGKATIQDAVNAVMHAEQSFQTMLAVRDKLVSAFQEFSHMSM